MYKIASIASPASMQISIKPPRIGTWILLVTSCLALTRFLVLFFESYSVVRAERQADIDLIELCSAGAAKDSDKFRSACMQARSERAAPIFLKAILKSIRTAFSDFSECFNSPTRIAILLLFCLSGLALPIVKTISTLTASYLEPSRLQGVDPFDDENQEQCRVVVLNGDVNSFMDAVSNRLRAFPGRRRQRLPLLSDIEDDSDRTSNAWTSVKLGKED